MEIAKAKTLRHKQIVQEFVLDPLTKPAFNVTQLPSLWIKIESCARTILGSGSCMVAAVLMKIFCIISTFVCTG